MIVESAFEKLQIVTKEKEVQKNEHIDAPPNSLMDSIVSPKGWKQRKGKELGTFFGSQHFGGRGACWSSRMGTRKIDKQVNHSHRLAQTKQQGG
jgi:hypothetical protein